MELLLAELPVERPYMPLCSPEVLCELGLAPGPTAAEVAAIGRGKVPARAAARAGPQLANAHGGGARDGAP